MATEFPPVGTAMDLLPQVASILILQMQWRASRTQRFSRSQSCRILLVDRQPERGTSRLEIALNAVGPRASETRNITGLQSDRQEREFIRFVDEEVETRQKGQFRFEDPLKPLKHIREPYKFTISPDGEYTVEGGNGTCL